MGRPKLPEEAIRSELKNVRNMLAVARQERDLVRALLVDRDKEIESLKAELLIRKNGSE